MYYRKDGTKLGDSVLDIMADPKLEKEFYEIWEANKGLNRRVDYTRTIWGNRISTVFLCLDHSFHSGKPLIFETMVWTKGQDEEWQSRYSTEEEAKAGHQKLLKFYRWFGWLPRRTRKKLLYSFYD